jgi:signal transduction histidine kinase
MKKGLFYISTAFILSLVIILYLCWLYYQSFKRSNNYISKVEHAYKVVLQISELENYLKEAETGQRGYLLTRDSSFLKPYQNIRHYIKPGYDSLRRLTAGNVTQQHLLNRAGLLINNSIDRFYHSIYLINSSDRNLTHSLHEGRQIMDSLRILFNLLEREESNMVKARASNQELIDSDLPQYFGAVFLFAFLILTISFVVIFKEFRQRFKYQKELEIKINAINTYNAELEQIAFATSHDLQEPLRRIQTFSDRLTSLYGDQLNEEGKMIVSRIDYSARRMQGLIEDLMNFTNLVRNGEELEDVNADELLNEVQQALQDKIKEKSAVIHMGQMPVITGYRQQLFLMFKSLLDNSLKFSKPGVPPVVTIQWVRTTDGELDIPEKAPGKREFIKISVRDNGLGFNSEFSQKMFLIFQRLHSGNEFEGKGIGLAIVERVMTNHNGFVRADGQPNQGAEFNLYFPVPDS